VGDTVVANDLEVLVLFIRGTGNERCWTSNRGRCVADRRIVEEIVSVMEPLAPLVITNALI
jgi:hypothetical protein